MTRQGLATDGDGEWLSWPVILRVRTVCARSCPILLVRPFQSGACCSLWLHGWQRGWGRTASCCQRSWDSASCWRKPGTMLVEVYCPVARRQSQESGIRWHLLRRRGDCGQLDNWSSTGGECQLCRKSVICEAPRDAKPCQRPQRWRLQGCERRRRCSCRTATDDLGGRGVSPVRKPNRCWERRRFFPGGS